MRKKNRIKLSEKQAERILQDVFRICGKQTSSLKEAKKRIQKRTVVRYIKTAVRYIAGRGRIVL